MKCVSFFKWHPFISLGAIRAKRRTAAASSIPIRGMVHSTQSEGRSGSAQTPDRAPTSQRLLGGGPSPVSPAWTLARTGVDFRCLAILTQQQKAVLGERGREATVAQHGEATGERCGEATGERRGAETWRLLEADPGRQCGMITGQLRGICLQLPVEVAPLDRPLA